MPPSTQHAEANTSEGLLAQNEEVEPGTQRREALKHVCEDCREWKIKWGGGGGYGGKAGMHR